MVLHDKTGGVIITRHRITRCNRLTRRFRNDRWAASAWRWGRRWGAAAAVRAFDRHGDARIGDGDAIRSIGINSQHHFTECDGGGQVGLRRSCDGKFLRLAETAGKAEVRWRNFYRKPRCNRRARCCPTRGRGERVAHGARPGAVRRALHIA